MQQGKDKSKVFNATLTITFGLFGGYLGYLTNFPAAPLLGAILFVAIANFLKLFQSYLPSKTIFWLQVFTGALLGSKITPQSLSTIWDLMLPIMVIGFVTAFSTIISTYLVMRIARWDIKTAYLGALPGRMTDIISIAKNLEANTTNITTVHLARILVVTFLTPIFIYFSGMFFK